MKKINDNIVKYLSGLMDQSEAVDFEERLKSSQELNEQFLLAKRKIGNFNFKSVETDENYFVNLVPRIRRRMESEKKYLVWKKVYFIAPALSVIILAILFYPRSTNNVFDYKELAEVVVNNLNDEAVQNNYLKNDINLDAVYSQDTDDTDFSVGLINSFSQIPESYLKTLDYSSVESRLTLNRMTDADLDKFYKKFSQMEIK